MSRIMKTRTVNIYLFLTKSTREFTGDAGVIVFAVGFIAAALR